MFLVSALHAAAYWTRGVGEQLQEQGLLREPWQTEAGEC